MSVLRLYTLRNTSRHAVYASRCYSKKSKSAHSQDLGPLDLNEEDVSRVHYLDPQEAKQIFPHGLSTKLATEMEAVGRGSWLLRQQSYKIIESFKLNETDQTPKFLLHGATGSGKSVCMSQVIHWCSRAGWIVVHVPNVFDWTHSRSELRPSPRHPGTFDQPHDAVQWLKNFRSANSSHLTEIKLTESHDWSKRERSEVNDDLGRVIEVGLLKPNLATDVVAMAIRMVAGQTSKKVLLAVDGFNGCFSPTSLKSDKKDWVEPEQLNLVNSVLENISREKFPGGVVLSLSRTKMYRHSIHGYAPEQLLGVKGMASVYDYRHLRVPDFKREEMDTWLTSSHRQRWISKEPTGTVSKELWQLSSGNPAELYRLCRAL